MSRKQHELMFGLSNAKLKKRLINTFSLPSGYACPGAKDCLSKANRQTGKITDGKEIKYRCFSAQEEAFKSSMRAARWRNFEILKEHPDTLCMAGKIVSALPLTTDITRIHIGGDYYNQEYFDAWLVAARLRPNMLFYSYTKSLNYWVNRIKQIPSNFSLVASRGGKHDHLIEEYNLCSAKVVYHPDAADALSLEIDHDDTHAMRATESFALLIHGVQPKGSVMAEAIKTLKQEKIQFSYQ